MKARRISVFLSAIMGFLLLSFNNCGKVSFQYTDSDAISKSGGPGSPDPAESDTGLVPVPVPVPSETETETGLNDLPNPGDGAMPAPGDTEDLAPLVRNPGVVTILLALGDQMNQQLVIKGFSSQLIAETAVRYASPIIDPKILVVKDNNTHGESAYDTSFIAQELLKRYRTEYLAAPTGGITPEHVSGYDLIWFNNPGHPMGNARSRDTLLGFSGGIVLSGDDMSQGNGFSLESLTGLRNVDNGEKVTCAGVRYTHDNNGGYQYGVGIVDNKFPGVPSDSLSFVYGNDIDYVRVLSEDTEVIAYAVGGHSTCTEARPVITRYERP